MKNTLTFKTLDQAVLFEGEIKGQLSDGAWQNSRPYDHQKSWCEADISVGSDVGRNFWAQKDNYGLTGSSFLAIVGPRIRFLENKSRKW